MILICIPLAFPFFYYIFLPETWQTFGTEPISCLILIPKAEYEDSKSKYYSISMTSHDHQLSNLPGES